MGSSARSSSGWRRMRRSPSTGTSSDARRRLATASFLLLTSSLEGFPLVLVEAMAAGCIPIAYDVPYGPSDVIVSGRNGFLVPAGDLDALTRAVAEFLRLPARRIATHAPCGHAHGAALLRPRDHPGVGEGGTTGGAAEAGRLAAARSPASD